MDKDIFELIVKRLTNSDDKTKQVMDIVFGNTSKLPGFKKCSENHFYKETLSCCPYCEVSIDCFVKCDNGHFYRKEEAGCMYCYPIFKIATKCSNGHLIRKGTTNCPECNCGNEKTVVTYETVNSKPVNKKQEIMDSLCYLKSKEKKTNQDKESIYTLEMILRNMK
jgi:hypothetical protein